MNPEASAAAPLTPHEALRKLLDGNQRYLERGSRAPQDFARERQAQAKHQDPYAVVLACGDSRVPPALLFDVGLADVFEVRVAGNVLDEAVLASIEYGALKASAEVVMVLGHERCGAVAAALLPPEERARLPGRIGPLTERIARLRPAIADKPGDPAENLMRENVAHVVAELRRLSPALKAAEDAGRIMIVGARYDLDDGKVALLEP